MVGSQYNDSIQQNWKTYILQYSTAKN